MDTKEIDELLLSGGVDNNTLDVPESADVAPEVSEEPSLDEPEEQTKEAEQSAQTPEDELAEDLYGNKEEVSKVVQKRLKQQAESLSRRFEAEIASLKAELANRQAPSSDEVPTEVDYQDQLEGLIAQTFTKMQQKAQQEQRANEEARANKEFADKITQGMERFSDFGEVIGGLGFDIPNPMTYAARGMEDPAGFLYAAAKRHPADLERIAKIRDPYAQVTEMVRLEEKLKVQKQSTSAPRPLGRVKEDGLIPQPKEKKELSIEELIAQSEAKKLAKLKQFRGR